jgi:nucleotide-binding universal stress UspA family protein
MSERANAEQRPVLIAYDGSEQAKAAIVEAGRVLDGGRRAVVLTVREPIEPYHFTGLGGATTLDPATVSAMQEAVQNEATAIAEEGTRLAREAGFSAEVRVGIAPSPWQEIVNVGDELDAAVIAIGSRGRTGISKVLLGSVASAVAQHSRRSVLIVHPETAVETDRG